MSVDTEVQLCAGAAMSRTPLFKTVMYSLQRAARSVVPRSSTGTLTVMRRFAGFRSASWRRTRRRISVGRAVKRSRGPRDNRLSTQSRTCWTSSRTLPKDAEARLPRSPEPMGGKLQEFALPTHAENYRPFVSIIVPTYNHGEVLEERLESIYRQTYQRPVEVYLLDDASSDHSPRILHSFAERFPTVTTLITNSENSGSAFRQWRCGLALVRGDIVWIAESDDLCDQGFLETLVPFMANPARTWALRQDYASFTRLCMASSAPTGSSLVRARRPYPATRGIGCLAMTTGPPRAFAKQISQRTIQP
jgi:hypothetical protein